MNHMNHGSMKSHILWMVGATILGLVILVGFLRFNFIAALPVAISLACPLGMLGMMFAMGKSMNHSNKKEEDGDNSHELHAPMSIDDAQHSHMHH
ncbi:MULTISPECIES: DUF2933 domain-containing protein [Bifidobacterium]|jgi:choline-glycine betaine transporter|nr:MULTISPECIES: DUF2933 domain-containing protein [Bifidobacterium]MCH3975549.1 DUF2933 domain-containing protein [Bifidobacterium tibiigranuli]MCI1833630.1 DUF2933 domain-containing protein [Bifidobacterium tibiigranuli]PKA94290.1 Protein of unknown function (DUF2933) [Bifidobacterium psychraerophilum DSM 22366]ROT86223.1 hypothetical protein BMONG18_1624 [Bifidobacterium mongoliense]